MKKLLLILAGVSMLSFQACKSGTADKDNTIDDGMHSSETSIGSGSTRPADRNAGETYPKATNQSGLDDGTDTINSEMGTKPIETAPEGNKPE